MTSVLLFFPNILAFLINSMVYSRHDMTNVVSCHIVTTDRSTLLRRILSIFNPASRRSSAFINFCRFRSLSVFLFSRRTGGLCDTFAGVSLPSSLPAPSSPAHSFNHVVWPHKNSNACHSNKTIGSANDSLNNVVWSTPDQQLQL